MVPTIHFQMECERSVLRTTVLCNLLSVLVGSHFMDGKTISIDLPGSFKPDVGQS